MKKRYFIAMLPLCCCLLACSDWLDVRPELEMRKNEMFEKEEGFKSVLTGAYIQIAAPTLYGKNMTMMLPEFMAHHWTAAPNTLAGYLSDFDHEQTASKELLAAIWLGYYQTIVNLNTLLGEIDARREIFTNGNYALIKGEALGLRAFLHLEVARLWGDAPAAIDPEQPAIPYVTTVTKDPNALLSLPYREVSRRILADLDSAELLLKDDPIITCFNSILNEPGRIGGYEQYNRPEDPYHYYRQSRFNYYAVKATKARFYHWTGDGVAAARFAGEVIDALNTENDKPKFTLGDEVAAQQGKLTFPSEHVFAVHNSRAQETVTPLFLQHVNGYTQDSARLREAYEATVHPADIRFKSNRLWQPRLVPLTGIRYNYFKKYVTDDREAVEVVPLIRLSEMYFIAIENGEVGRFAAYRVARNLDSSLDAGLTTEEAILARLEKEYRKEFYGEGQMFYFYKRHNYDRFTWPAPYTMDVSRYKLPRPEVQSLFETL
jgi:hypothetical protein